MRLPPACRGPSRERNTFAVLKSMLNERRGVARAYRPSHGIGRVSSVRNAPTTYEPYRIASSASAVSVGSPDTISRVTNAGVRQRADVLAERAIVEEVEQPLLAPGRRLPGALRGDGCVAPDREAQHEAGPHERRTRAQRQRQPERVRLDPPARDHPVAERD